MPASKTTPAAKKATKTTKPKAAKKAVAEPIEVEAAPEAVAKPAKKAVKKAAAEVEAPAVAPAEVAKPKKAAAKKAKAVEEAAAEPETIPAPKAKKSAKPKAEKGRDLVVDEPGAAEVAAVLHHEDSETEDSEDSDEPEIPAFKGPEPKLERLQKILAKAGISSRRKAEELILGGQVQINGKVVTELGTKADASRDHVRVDGKLLQGAERIRYFVLNKPKGFVTTVSDPEGRPTVMQFFASERERLYPVGRLDYLSEGLLLVTNDGDLANKLTKAASGVEKTYLVKVAGQPTEDMLDVLRGGVVIEKGRPGTFSGRVRTAPAQIRQVRQGDNPWYEVIIIEGRNRELRKMFEEIGHHVEKIRRIGYGPLILDLEPGKLRELEPEEVRDLHLVADGKLKTRRRRGPQQAQLPTVAGKTVRYKKADGKPGYEPRVRPAVRPEFQVESPADARPEGLKGLKRIPKTDFHDGDKPAFKARPKAEFRPQGKPDFKGDYKPRTRIDSKPGFKSGFKSDARPDSRPVSRPSFRSEGKPPYRAEGKPAFRPEGKPEFRPADRADFKTSARPPFKSAGRPSFGDRSNAAPRARRPEPPVTDYVLPVRKNRPELDDDATPQKGEFNPDYKPGFRSGDRPAAGPRADRTDRPSSRSEFRPEFRSGGRSGGGARSRPGGERQAFPLAGDDDYVPTKTPGFKVEPVEDKPRTGGFDRPRSGGFDRAGGGKSFRPRPEGGRPEGGRSGGFAGGGKPFRPREDAPAGEGRTFNRNAGRPAGGPKSFGDRPRPSGPGARPFRPAGPGGPGGAGSDRGPRTGDDRPREFRPSSAPKKFAGSKPAAGPRKTGPDGEPRIKERWRNSFTGKNKGRPKPRPKGE